MGERKGPSFEKAADFMWRNARLLERALFAHHFLDGTSDAVVAALYAYRNPDGGFGHGLEPDVRAPASMPLHCGVALEDLEMARVHEPELALGVCRFLASIAEPSGRVPNILPATFEYPHAGHWDERGPPDASGPTPALAGSLLAQRVEHPWLARAVEWCWKRLERPGRDAHEVSSYLKFLAHVPERSRAQDLAVQLAQSTEGFFDKEPGTTMYGLTPLTLCPTPDALARAAFPDALLEAHLDDLTSRQQDDGGWPISWKAPSPASELEWRGHFTVQAMVTLRVWGR